MKKQVPTVIEIEGLAPSTLTAPDERREPISLDGRDDFRSRRPEGARRCAGLSTPWLSPAAAWPGSMLASGSTPQRPRQPDHRKTGQTR